MCRRFIPTFIILYLSIFFIFSASKPLIQQKQIAISGAGSRITPVSSSSSSGSGGTKSIKLSLNKLKEQRREKFASILEEDEDFGMSKETKVFFFLKRFFCGMKFIFLFRLTFVLIGRDLKTEWTWQSVLEE